MEDLFDTWLEATEETDDRKTLWRATEIDGQRAEVLGEIAQRTCSHYISDDEIATFLEALDYNETAKMVRETYPEGSTGRSGDIGEILCAEVIEEWCGFDVPIRKLRYKDHREQAMRGEDVIGICHDTADQLCLLKAEAKSAQVLSTNTVNEARSALDATSGRPTSHSMIYIARQLLGQGGEAEVLGKSILQEAARKAVPKSRITHCFFALTGNAAGGMIDDDFEQVEGGRDQFIIHIRIPEHAQFIAEIYDEVNELALN